jgi:hypothetical protein
MFGGYKSFGTNKAERGFYKVLFDHGPVVQLDRISDSGSEGWGFESLRGRKSSMPHTAAFFIFHYIFNDISVHHTINKVHLSYVFLKFSNIA